MPESLQKPLAAPGVPGKTYIELKIGIGGTEDAVKAVVELVRNIVCFAVHEEPGGITAINLRPADWRDPVEPWVYPPRENDDN